MVQGTAIYTNIKHEPGIETWPTLKIRQALSHGFTFYYARTCNPELEFLLPLYILYWRSVTSPKKMFPWEFTIYWNSCSWMENLLKNKEEYNYFYFFREKSNSTSIIQTHNFFYKNLYKSTKKNRTKKIHIQRTKDLK